MTKKVKHKNKFDKSISKIISSVNKQFGEDVLFSIAEKGNIHIESISTGLPSVDMVLGIGGIPKGRIVELFGPESQGKTTLALHMIMSAQKLGYNAAFIDAEHALDIFYAKNIGVNIDDLLISQPDYGEQALDLVKFLIEQKIGVIVIDSVSALVPKAELEGDVEKMTIALQARMMSKHLRQITSLLGKRSGTCVVFINQVREKVGVVWGNPEDTTGGRALKFYSTMRIDVRKRGKSKRVVRKDGKPDAIRCALKVVKNKVAPPYAETEFEIVFGKGVDIKLDVINAATYKGIIKKSGAFYSINGIDKKFHGEKELVKYFSNDKRMNKLIKLINSMNKIRG